MSITSREWTPVQTLYDTYRDPVVFLSTPLTLYGRDNEPVQARISNMNNNDGALSFDVKLVMPNDSYCSKEWWVPEDYPGSLNVTWLVMESGGYSINGTQTVVNTAEVSGYVTKVDWDYTFGSECNYPTQEGDTDFAPGVLLSLQSFDNEMFVVPRATSLWTKGEVNKCSYSWSTGRFFLDSHDGYPVAERYNMRTELLGYLLFDQYRPHVIDCVEGYFFEFGMIDRLTDSSMLVDLHEQVDASVQPVGLFATLVSYYGGDSSSLRTYYTSPESASDMYIFIQEDQCEDEEEVHLEESTSYLFISTTSRNCTLEENPVFIYYTEAPTSIPSGEPTRLPSITGHPTSSAPTTALQGQEDRKNKSKDSDGSGVLLAIILPIIILAVIAIVGLVARAYFVAGPSGATALADSDHSDNNLVQFS